MAARSARLGSGATWRHAASSTGQKVRRCSAVGSPTPHSGHGGGRCSCAWPAAVSRTVVATCAALPASAWPRRPT
eukprot:9805629-Alexandrium_andersonii.AAC.1